VDAFGVPTEGEKVVRQSIMLRLLLSAQLK
jgi:hypothetical protein